MPQLSPRSVRRSALLIVAGLLLAHAPIGLAFLGAMSPSNWFGGDRYDDYYYDDYYGGPGPYGYGPPGYGLRGYGPYGGAYGWPGQYGAPGYYGGPGYFGYGAPGYGAGGVPSGEADGPSTSEQAREIESLKRRIEELESREMPPPAPPMGTTPDWPSAPAFRPQDQY